MLQRKRNTRSWTWRTCTICRYSLSRHPKSHQHHRKSKLLHAGRLLQHRLAALIPPGVLRVIHPSAPENAEQVLQHPLAIAPLLLPISDRSAPEMCHVIPVLQIEEDQLAVEAAEDHLPGHHRDCRHRGLIHHDQLHPHLQDYLPVDDLLQPNHLIPRQPLEEKVVLHKYKHHLLRHLPKIRHLPNPRLGR